MREDTAGPGLKGFKKVEVNIDDDDDAAMRIDGA